ncbi:hypothetical protein PAE53_25420 (plasmid) [Sphingobium yanoikuyae]|nr:MULTISPECIES: hypothetical protein [Sphingobium]WBQ19162.1 hypothetical protein PAE53_25420 [Sphingobium yanoikuyae]
MGFIRTLVAAAAGFAIYRHFTRDRSKTPASPPYPSVRDAGPENMATPPRAWTKEDETSDESFPASDPPSTY